MPELFEDQTADGFDIQHLVGIVGRRHLHFLIPLFFGWLIIWGASWVLPPRYKSSTLILVEQQTMPQNYVVPNVNDDLQVRLESIKQQILSRTRLLTIIDKLSLYGGTQSAVSADEQVESMRKDIDVELVRDPQRQNISSFRVSYSARDPHVAQHVTGELTNLFISENQKVLQEESAGTTSFIEQQLEEARASLSDQESKVRQFEAQHLGDLPTQEASNLQILAGLQAQLQNEQDALNTAKQQRVYLQASLQQERAAQSAARPLNENQAGLLGPTDLTTINQQLDKLRSQLAELSSRYTDRYPDVQSLKDQIAKTEKIRDVLIAAEKQREADPKLQGSAVPDPTLSAAARQLQGQLQANQLEIANRESTIESLKARIGDYQGRLNVEPAVEQQLADLTRGYDQSKANYDDLLKKKDQSQMATSMEEMQQGERFTMLDPPSLPTKPDFPNRLKFCGYGLAVGLALGFLVAGGLEFFDDRLHTERDIKSLLPIAVISEIPQILSPLDRRRTKRRMALGWATTALVFVALLAGSVFSYLHN